MTPLLSNHEAIIINTLSTILNRSVAAYEYFRLPDNTPILCGRPYPFYTEGVVPETDSKTLTPYFRRERPYFRDAVNRVIREETRRALTLPEVHEALEAC
jgi:hypothetical protein